MRLQSLGGCFIKGAPSDLGGCSPPGTLQEAHEAERGRVPRAPPPRPRARTRTSMSDRLKERKVSACALDGCSVTPPTAHSAVSVTKMCHTGFQVWRSPKWFGKGDGDRERKGPPLRRSSPEEAGGHLPKPRRLARMSGGGVQGGGKAGAPAREPGNSGLVWQGRGHSGLARGTAPWGRAS